MVDDNQTPDEGEHIANDAIPSEEGIEPSVPPAEDDSEDDSEGD